MPYIVVNDARLSYEDHGVGPQTILFAHGLLWSGKMFAKQVDVLRSRYRCITFDWRGQGQSAVTRDGYDMESLYTDTFWHFCRRKHINEAIERPIARS